MPNALFVYPKFPPSYWGFKYALDFLGKRSSMPPLGLLTIAGMFPENYNLKVVDLNIEPLTDAHIPVGRCRFDIDNDCSKSVPLRGR